MRLLILAALLLFPGSTPGQGGSGLAGCLGSKPKGRWVLPPDLWEVSGLAMTDDGRLLAHDDERARIVEIDYRSGRIVKSFRFGPRMPLGDFEGLAIAGTRVFLVTSAGVLYEGREGRDGEAVPYRTIATNAGARCEVEGLAWEPRDRSLLFLCKTPRLRELLGAITVLRWSVDQSRWMVPDRIIIPLGKDLRKMFGSEFRGSDLARDPKSGHYLAVAGIDHAVVELSLDGGGKVLSAGRLGRHHPQAEGVAVAVDGTVLVSDEGGKAAARLTVYACAR